MSDEQDRESFQYILDRTRDADALEAYLKKMLSTDGFPVGAAVAATLAAQINIMRRLEREDRLREAEKLTRPPV